MDSVDPRDIAQELLESDFFRALMNEAKRSDFPNRSGRWMTRLGQVRYVWEIWQDAGGQAFPANAVKPAPTLFTKPVMGSTNLQLLNHAINRGKTGEPFRRARTGNMMLKENINLIKSRFVRVRWTPRQYGHWFSARLELGNLSISMYRISKKDWKD